jgi:phage recombination protein Bet
MLTKAKSKTAALVAPEHARPASVLARLAGRFGVEQGKMLECLKATAFRGQVSNEQMMALCVVADQYGLNPWTKEIYAFPDKNNGIVPVVGVDGWARIINEHPQFDGIELVDAEDGSSCTCTIYRKDRTHPTTVMEYMAECKRNTSPWQSHPRRMLRHKALIQCARIAFGYAGIYDQDEAERILEGVEVGPARTPVEMPREIPPAAASPERCGPAVTEPEPDTAAPAKTDAAPAYDRETVKAEIAGLIETSKAPKIAKAMKAVGIGWQDGEAWEQAPDETLRALVSLLRC